MGVIWGGTGTPGQHRARCACPGAGLGYACSVVAHLVRAAARLAGLGWISR